MTGSNGLFFRCASQSVGKPASALPWMG
jgi:hypothetical protein